MEKLRILLLVLWCSVLVLPVQVTAVPFAAPLPATQQVSDQEAGMALVLTTATLPAESKAVQQLDRDVLLPVLQQPGQLFCGITLAAKVSSAFPAFIKANGLHTILTAGP